MFSDWRLSGAQPAVSLGGEFSVAGEEADRLLVEELKGELSQTKLELETTLKAQHKHLKELDTLRFVQTFLSPVG